MPNHLFKCSCGTEFTLYQDQNHLEEFEKCLNCGEMAKKVWASNGSSIRVFKPQYFEHLGSEPVYIESKKQLHDECVKRGVRSSYIENSFNRRF